PSPARPDDMGNEPGRERRRAARASGIGATVHRRCSRCAPRSPSARYRLLRCRVHVRQLEDSSAVITLTIISYNGAPVSRGASATFEELGGTIGRADNNQLVLEDPDRTISRVHAQIVFRSGNYAVLDRG